MTDNTTDHRARMDWHGLVLDLNASCARRLVSLRTAANQMGIPVGALCRFRQGGKLSADSVARLVAWMYPRHVPAWIIQETKGEEGA